MKQSLIAQVAKLVWDNDLLAIDELLNSHIENRGPHLREIIEGRRQYLTSIGMLHPLPPLALDMLDDLRQRGEGYVRKAGDEYGKPNIRTRK